MSMEYDKIRLRALEKTDLPLKVKWVNDPQVNATLYFETPLSLSKTEIWFHNNIGNDNRRDFTIETLEGEPIGVTGLVGINYIHRTAECYCIIGEKKFWGKGIGTIVHSMLISWAFDKLDLHKIWSVVSPDNVAILKVVEKLGFRKEGILREEKYISGKRVDVIRIGVLRNEFKNLTQKASD